MEGQTIIRLAKPLSCKLALPLFTQVWDPLEWWLRENNIDAYTRRRLLAEFDEVIKHSKSCASASWAMSKTYSHKYGVRSIPVIASLPNKFAKIPATKPHENRNEFIIAIAGQLYAQDAWQCLINTLNQVNWSIAERRIRLRVLGAYFQVYTQSPTNFEYLGWQSQEETINFLEDSDILYMPYWFSEEYRLEATNSFPGKLVSYFAAGRPVFCHTPYYASPTRYIAKHNAGILCTSMDSLVVLQKLEHAILNTTSYAIVTKNATACFLMDFTLEHMQKTFFEFLGLDSASKNNLKNKFSEVYDKNFLEVLYHVLAKGLIYYRRKLLETRYQRLLENLKLKPFLMLHVVIGIGCKR
ncbi:MAG: glycosyltransferase [Candidatus Tisiphia sp.]